MAISEEILNKLSEEQKATNFNLGKDFNFYSALDENQNHVYGMILKELGEPKEHYEFVPFFQKNDDNTLSVNLNTTNMVVNKNSIQAGFSQDHGLQIWKELIKEEGLNPELTIKAKSSQFLNDDIDQSLQKNIFSLKNQFDKALYVQSNILKNADKNANFEDVFDEIYRNVKNSTTAIKSGLKDALKAYEKSFDNEKKLQTKGKIEKLIQLINVEKKNEDLKFIDDFSTKFKEGSLEDKDVLQFLEKYKNQNTSVSDIITDYVEFKKQNLTENVKENNIDKYNSDKIANNDIINIKLNDDTNIKGKVLNVSDNELQIKLPNGKEKEFSLKDNSVSKITKLAPGQKFTIDEVKEAFKDLKNIKWDSLSIDSQINLLKNQPSQLFKAAHQINYENDYKESNKYEFKLILERENGKLKVKPLYKDLNFKLEEFQISETKLTEEQVKKLKEGEQIKFEVFNKEGVLQTSNTMKYDSSLNRVSFGSDKGKDFAITQKKGTEQKFYMKATKMKM